MADSYGQFTLWVSVYHLLKSEPSCTSHKPRASYQRWLVRGDLEHEISPYAATQSYIYLNQRLLSHQTQCGHPCILATRSSDLAEDN